MEWHEAIDYIKPYIVRVSSPQGSGTGFFLANSADSSVVGIATAAHVVEYAEEWEQPIKITHLASEETRFLQSSERVIYLDQEKDTAAILFHRNEMPFPDEPLQLIEEDSYLRQGVSIGWLGFPASIQQRELCFFTGVVSAYLDRNSSYLVDGVIINGVSGGPTFYLTDEGIEVIGLVSGYIPNRANGESMPGVGLVNSVAHMQQHVSQLASWDDAVDDASDIDFGGDE